VSPNLEDLSKEELVSKLRELQADPRLQQQVDEHQRVLHELQVHQIELEMQNRELRGAQQLLEESRSHYADLFDLAPVAYCMLDRDGRIQAANLTASALLRVDRAILIERLLVSFVADESKRAYRAHLQKCWDERVRVTTEVKFTIRDRAVSCVQLVSTPLFDVHGKVTSCKTTLSDISELKHSQDLLRFLADASETLASSLDPSATLRRLARLTVPVLADVCCVHSATEVGDLELLEVSSANVNSRQSSPDVPLGVLGLGTDSLQARVFRSGEPLLVSDLASLPNQDLQKAAGTSSLMCIPLVTRGRTFGVLTLAMADSGRRYTQTDFALALDIARRATTAIDNAELYEAARRALRMREDILAIVSHDLRSPLNNIMLGAGAMAGSSSDHDRSRHHDIIARAVQTMDRMIGDLLDFSSIEAGHLFVEQGEHEVQDLLDEALEVLSPLASARGLRLEVEGSSESRRVLCDQERVLQVLTNIVGNAIKFTPPGGLITLGVELGAGSSVCFYVRDTGPGIPEKLSRHIFDRYWQAKETAKKGRGLGLYIARGIVEAMGGRIWVDSVLGKGATFFFTLPVVPRSGPVSEDTRPGELQDLQSGVSWESP
jgi:PAS domain S-box-containing protein